METESRESGEKWAGKRGERVTRATIEDLEVGVPFDASALAMPEGGQIDTSLDGR